MSMYENLVMQTQRNYSRYYGTYAAGKTPVRLSDRKPLPYEKQIEKLIEKIKEADCIVVGGASGLSAAGGGDFYYEDTPSFRRYFGKFAEKYGFKGAFAGMGHPYKTRGEFWAYLATFLHTTQTAPIREPYLDLDAILLLHPDHESGHTVCKDLSGRKGGADPGGSSLFPVFQTVLRPDMGCGKAGRKNDRDHGRRHKYSRRSDPTLSGLRCGGVSVGARLR